jgi:rSAM/selenodomain-associated transferase 1
LTAALLVIAKAPVPGRVKTRLCPPLTPEEAAALALAGLEDTLAAVAASAAARRVVVLDGEPGAWLPAGFEVEPQAGGGLGARMAAAFAAVATPALLIGSDAPQVTPRLLDAGLSALAQHDAVLGPAHDGGYWAIGLRRPAAGAFDGIPMSDPGTAAAQRARLAELGLSVAELAPLRDVDTIEDARAVADAAPAGRFAAAVGALRLTGAPTRPALNGRPPRPLPSLL